MDQNEPISKKLWNIVRFLLYMIRKGVSKHKLIADFNATLKRGKNLMFHHRRRVPAASTASDAVSSPAAAAPRQEYEFSCSNTPNYTFPFTNISFMKKKSHNSLFACGQTPQTLDDDAAAARAVLELLHGDKGNVTPAYLTAALSPYFPGFGRTPLVRPLRVTDSPFPLTPENGDVNKAHVDQAADDFIKKFYKNLNQQKKMIEFS